MRFTWQLLGSVALLGACDKAADEAREWSPVYQDNQGVPNAAAPEPPAAKRGQPKPGKPSEGALATMQTWSRLCVRCHGRFGHGDGPNGKSLAVPDFSSKQWQSKVSDARLAQSIQSGRGAMPAFPQPRDTIEGLVQLVRRMGPAQRATPPAPAGSGSSGALPPGHPKVPPPQ